MKKDFIIPSLIEFKKRTGLSWSIISSEIGVNKCTMSRWVNGKFDPLPVYEKIIARIIKKNS